MDKAIQNIQDFVPDFVFFAPWSYHRCFTQMKNYKVGWGEISGHVNLKRRHLSVDPNQSQQKLFYDVSESFTYKQT